MQGEGRGSVGYAAAMSTQDGEGPIPVFTLQSLFKLQCSKNSNIASIEASSVYTILSTGQNCCIKAMLHFFLMIYAFYVYCRAGTNCRRENENEASKPSANGSGPPSWGDAILFLCCHIVGSDEGLRSSCGCRAL